MYTQFRKQVESRSDIRREFVMPMQMKLLPDAVEPGDIPAFQDFGQGGKKTEFQ